MPTTANSITYFVAADGTLRDGQQGSIAQQPRLNYGTEYAVTLSFPASTIAEGDQLQVAVNRSRTFFSSASATGDAPVAAVAKHEVTAEEADAQAVTLTLSTNTRAMIDQVNGIDHPVRGFFGVHILKNQSFVTLAVADAFMLSVESGPDAISPSLPVVDYPTREEAEALTDRSEAAAERAEQAAAGIVPPLQLDAPPTTSTAGSVGQLAVYHDSATNKDHLYHLVYITTSDSATLYHWEECVLVSQGNVAGGYPVLDANGKVAAAQLPINTFKLGGTTALPATEIAPINGEIIIPLCSSNGFQHRGLLFVDGYYGFSVADNYAIRLTDVTNNNINDRLARRYFALNQLDYAVRSVLPNITEIPAATSDYSLVDSSATTLNHSHTFVHTPSQAPTYRLPSVSDTTVSHYIELTVDFSNVQTYSFLDSNGDALVPLFTPSVAAGDVYTFRMEYSAIKAKWLIYPQKQGAVADDFVMRCEVGAANGVAGLDSSAKVPSTQLPVASNTTLGAVKIAGSYGVGLNTNNEALYINKASNADINNRTSNYLPIVPSNLNYAVRSVLPNVTEIPAATSDYSLVDSSATTNNHSHVYSHAPATAPTYRLPQVTNTAIAHYIELTVDFTAVQTYSFLDNAGEPIVPLFTPAIAAGDVYTFKMEYSAIKAAWLIYPQKQGAVADDFVMRGEVGAANGVAGLDANAIVPSSQLPKGNREQFGVVKIPPASSGHAIGFTINNNLLYPAKALDSEINTRTLYPSAGYTNYNIICPGNLNYAVTAALTDNNKISLTDAQKAAAQEVFGVGGTVVTIPAATSEYTLSYGRFSHVPTLASVYKMPAVANGSITNDITLSIKFSSSVLTYEFQDSAGNTLVPLPLNGDIEDGSVVTFLCRYNPLLSQWVIYPIMDGKEAQE